MLMFLHVGVREDAGCSRTVMCAARVEYGEEKVVSSGAATGQDTTLQTTLLCTQY